MNRWLQVKGIVKQGHGVASGQNGDRRFPQGTLALQKPVFKNLGLCLESYFPGTINVSIHPHQYAVKQAKHTFKNVKWVATEPAEDFSFFDCKVHLNDGRKVGGLIYYPHPETKPEHFQAPDILEIMTPFIQGLNYGDQLILELDRAQIDIYPAAD